jgi:hypothetical protein
MATSLAIKSNVGSNPSGSSSDTLFDEYVGVSGPDKYTVWSFHCDFPLQSSVLACLLIEGVTLRLWPHEALT